MKPNIVLAAALLAVAGAAHAAERRPVVAVFPIQDSTGRLSEKALANLTNYFAAKIAETGKFAVVPRADIEAALRVQKAASYKECYDQSCQIEIGRELAAQKVVQTQIIQIGDQCAVTVSLYDLALAASETAATRKGACGENELVPLLEGAAQALAGSIAGGSAIAAESSSTGGLFVKSEPAGGTVWLDGRQLDGTTPLTLQSVPEGEHQIEVRRDDRGKSAKVVVRKNDFTRLELTLEALTGSIRVVSDPPDADVEVDGRRSGKTPIVVRDIFYGEHHLRVIKEGFVTDESAVEVRGAIEVAKRLVPAAILRVETVPAGAEVRVGGRVVGASPVQTHVPPEARVDVVASIAGHDPAKKTVTMPGPGKTESLRLELSESADRIAQRRAYEAAAKQYAQELDAYESDKSNLIGWLALLGGLGAAGGAAGMFITAAGAHDDYSGAVLAGDISDRYGSASGAEIGGWVLGSAAIAAVGYCIFEWGTAPTPPVRPEAPLWYGGAK